MKNFLKLSLILLLFLNACKDKHEISLSHTNADGLVKRYGNLTFSFDQNIVSDSIVQQWMEKEYVSFSPDIEGRFKWTSTNELTFSPTSALPPATSFTAKLKNTIAKENKNLGSVVATDIYFYTEKLQLNNSAIFWYSANQNTPGVKLDLEFNAKVNVKNIKNALTITNEDKKVDFEILNSSESYIVNLVLNDIPVTDKDFVFDITLEKGLTPVGGKDKTTDPIVDKLLLKSPLIIDIMDVNSDHNGQSGTITVATSQGISSTNISSYISIKPTVKFRATATDKNIIIESSDFDPKTSYELTIKEGVKGNVGGKLQSNFTRNVMFGELEPSIRFDSKSGEYLSSAGSKSIGVSIVNVPEVRVRIYKLYENNILNKSKYNYNYQEKDVVYNEVVKTIDLKKIGSSSLLTLEFKDILKEYKGMYYVEVQSTEDYWLNDYKYLSFSDIGVIVKEGVNDVKVFVNSIKTAESLSGVKIRMIGFNNQLISETVTASDGSATLSYKNKDLSGFKPALITAQKNADFTAVNLNNTQVYTSRFDVGGYRDLPNGLQTYIYFERNLYRPGEIVNFATIVRNTTWNSPGKLPLVIHVINPSGKKIKTYTKTLNEDGSLEASFHTKKEYLTGAYSIQIYTSNNVLLASKNVMIEEFMPDRIKVNTALNKKEIVMPDNSFQVTVSAQNLFGPPAANRNYEMEVSYNKKYFYAEDFPNYNFTLTNTSSYLEKKFREGKTDVNGKAAQNFEINNAYKNMGLIEADVFTTVFDETGRPVNRKNTLKIYTQDVFYGIGYMDYYLSTNSKINIPLAAVDKNGTATNAKAKVKIIKHEYQTVLNKSGGYFRYESNKVEKEVYSKVITLNGTSSFTYIPKISGKYEIRISGVDEEKKYVREYFYAYGYGSNYLSSFEVNKEGNVTIETDKENYEVGDKAKLLFNTPFKGKLLVTLETNDVMDYYYLNTDKRSASLTIDITEKFMPNVYISAVLIKPHTSSQFPLTVAHGFQSIQVNQTERKMDVRIDVAESSRSKTKQKIKIKAAPNSYVSIAAVDEGILQVGNYKTPDPYNYFYQKRALQVNTYDIYPYLLPEISASSVTGGDGALDMSKRINPFQNERVKLVSYWSGLIKTNALGNAEYEIDIPQFSGSIRVMAVAHKNKSFGHAEEYIKVADPIVISSTIPRFLSPGDTAFVSSTLSNTTSKHGKAKSSIRVTGSLGIVDELQQTVEINANSEGQALYKVYAKNNLGKGKIIVTAKAFGEAFTEETDISIRPAVPLLQSSESGSLKGGKNVQISFDKNKYLANTVDYKLVLSKNPMVEFSKDLDYLVRYPYGCSEQTVSAVFPQLYYKDLVESIYKKDVDVESTNQNIIVAINKLKMRQIYNGAINMWDNCDCENWWVTAYTAHFLVEAKKMGYPVDDNFLENTLSYLKTKLKQKEVNTFKNSNGLTVSMAPREVAYSLYVLALANTPDRSLMSYYKSYSNLLTPDGKYLLSAAYMLSGDKERGKAILPSVFRPSGYGKENGGSFSSPLQEEAIALNALLHVDPDNNNIGIMVKHLSEQLRTKRYINTQERVFSFLALGKVAKIANESNITATIKSNGSTIGNYKDGVSTFYTKDIANGQVDITTKGTGTLYYFWQAEGISKDGSFTQEDANLKVRKSFYNRFGQPINNRDFNQNDLIVIELSIQTTYNSSIDNVVITDMLPAGFEIENSRITDVPGMDWVKNASYPNHLDIRDDRILIFDDVNTTNNNAQKYYYVVRAVSPGVYKMGPVGAEAMYNGAYHSYHGGGVIVIK